MRSLALSLMIIIQLVSCNNDNAHLFDNAPSSSDTVSGATGVQVTTTTMIDKADPYGHTCRHSEGQNYTGVFTSEYGECLFYACADSDYVEFSKHQEYQAYVDLHGGKVVDKPDLCKTKKEYGKGCCHPDAIDFIGAACDVPGPCRFEVCTDPNYKEFHSGQFKYFTEYTSNYGGEVLNNQSLCKTPMGGCKYNSPNVTNYDASATEENGSCIFRGCDVNGASNFSQAFADEVRNYIASLNGKSFTGKVIKTCDSYGATGCTFAGASNTNPSANIEDGSCNIACCGLEGHELYNSRCQSTIDSYKNLLNITGTTQSGNLNNAANCGNKFGCYFKAPGYVTNSSNGDGCTACAEDGSCNIRCCGDENATNYDPNCKKTYSTYLNALVQMNVSFKGTFSDKFNCNYPVNGCSFQNGYVSNYSPNKKEDGTCNIACCGQAGFENYDPNCKKSIDEYTAILQGLGLTLSGNVVDNLNCGRKLDCAYEPANNDIPGSKENGTCNVQCCSIQGMENYDPSCQGTIDTYKGILAGMGIAPTGNLSNNFNCGGKVGCTYPGASNTDPAATKENGTCTILCCSDQSNDSYDPNCLKKFNEYKGILAGLNIAAQGEVNSMYCPGKKLGCSYAGAINTEAGSKENGSCIIQCCAQSGFENYDPNCKVKVDGYNSLLSSLGVTLSGSINTSYQCGKKKGCTSAQATNTTPGATLDDGSCQFTCKKCEEGFSGETDQACLDKVTEYQAMIQGIGVAFTGSVNILSSHCKPEQCSFMDSRVTNFKTGGVENGSCDFECCSVAGMQGFDKECKAVLDGYKASLATLGITYTGTASLEVGCGEKLGCAFDQASNFEKETVENGSCNIGCCADAGSENFDPACSKRIDDYKKILTDAGLTSSGTLDSNFNCGKKLDCNYDSDYTENHVPGTKENGSCIVNCCADNKFENFKNNCESVADGYMTLLNGLKIPLTGAINKNHECGKQLGCAYDKAENSNPDFKENGSCTIKCCSKEGFENFDPECKNTVSGYTAILAQLGVSPTGTINDKYKCGKELGCNYKKADNYDGIKKENGSCDIKCCAKEGFTGFDKDCKAKVDDYINLLGNIAPTGDLSKEFQCGDKIGCMEKLADNFDPTAQADPNFECKFTACNNPGFANYDVDKKIRDAWKAYGHGTLLPGECGEKLACAYEPAENDVPGAQENGSCHLVGCTDQRYDSFDPDFDNVIAKYKAILKQLGLSFSGKIVRNKCTGLKGCTEKSATNFNPEAEVDDKTCKFSGCIDPKAVNYDEDLHDVIKGLDYKPVIKDSCKFNEHYSCLCDAKGTATKYRIGDQLKSLVITNKGILNSLADGYKGFTLNFGRLLGALAPNPTCQQKVFQSYVDGYNFEKLADKEVLPRKNVRDLIDRHWQRDAATGDYFIDGAPYELIAIVFRPDLEKQDDEEKIVSYGEGRFVFKLKDVEETVKVPCNTTVTTNTCTGSRYGCRKTTKVVEKTCDKKVVTKEPSHVIFEYDLPGELDWHYNWAKLKCLKGDAYKDHLVNIIKSFAFTDHKYKECTSRNVTDTYGHTTTVKECNRMRKPLSQVRVNDLRELDFNSNTSWALFEMRPLEASCNGLERVEMPLTPIDNGGEHRDIRAEEQIFKQVHQNDLANDFVSQFNKIADPFEGYTVNKLAWQNTYFLDHSWARELEGHQATKNLSEPERSFALYRYSLNTCAGCHSGAFVQHNSRDPNGLDLTSNQMVSKYGKLRFRDIKTANDFLHIHADGSLSPFMKEDLGYRAEDLEMSLTDNFCADPGSFSDMEDSVDPGVFNCEIDLNFDNVLDEKDVAIYRQLASSYAAKKQCITIPDLNGDGLINKTDHSWYANLIGDNGLKHAANYAPKCRNLETKCGNKFVCPKGHKAKLVKGTKDKYICESIVVIDPAPTCKSWQRLVSVGGKFICSDISCGFGKKRLANGQCVSTQTCPTGYKASGTRCCKQTINRVSKRVCKPTKVCTRTYRGRCLSSTTKNVCSTVFVNQPVTSCVAPGSNPAPTTPTVPVCGSGKSWNRIINRCVSTVTPTPTPVTQPKVCTGTFNLKVGSKCCRRVTKTTPTRTCKTVKGQCTKTRYGTMSCTGSKQVCTTTNKAVSTLDCGGGSISTSTPTPTPRWQPTPTPRWQPTPTPKAPSSYCKHGFVYNKSIHSFKCKSAPVVKPPTSTSSCKTTKFANGQGLFCANQNPSWRNVVCNDGRRPSNPNDCSTRPPTSTSSCKWESRTFGGNAGSGLRNSCTKQWKSVRCNNGKRAPSSTKAICI